MLAPTLEHSLSEFFFHGDDLSHLVDPALLEGHRQVIILLLIHIEVIEIVDGIVVVDDRD